MIIPAPLQAFITRAIVPGDMCLPYHYPKLEHFATFQSCYRYHGNTLEDLTSTTPGAFQPGWYVVSRNYFGDAFIVDFTEEAQGFPVYYAPIGAGQWVATKVTDTLAQFAILLTDLASMHDDAKAQLAYLQAHVDTTAEPWQEVCTSLAAEPEL